VELWFGKEGILSLLTFLIVANSQFPHKTSKEWEKNIPKHKWTKKQVVANNSTSNLEPLRINKPYMFMKFIKPSFNQNKKWENLKHKHSKPAKAQQLNSKPLQSRMLTSQEMKISKSPKPSKTQHHEKYLYEARFGVMCFNNNNTYSNNCHSR
jgi:hypothetical protein